MTVYVNICNRIYVRECSTCQDSSSSGGNSSWNIRRIISSNSSISISSCYHRNCGDFCSCRSSCCSGSSNGENNNQNCFKYLSKQQLMLPISSP